jgi:Transglycosylase SLT domain
MRSRRAAPLAAAVVALAWLVTAAPGARAGEVKVPLTIDYVTLSEALRHALYTAPGGRTELWNGEDECQFLYATDPAFSRAGVRVRLETAGNLGLGVSVAGHCISPISWEGIIEAQSQPYIAPGLALKFRIADLNFFNPQHEKTLLAGKGFDLIKQYFIPRLETFSYDLNPAVNQLGTLAADASPAEAAERVRRALASVRAEPTVETLDDGVRVTLIITVPDFPTPAARATPAEPTQQELAAFQKLVDQWDAFLVFAVKQLGETVGDKQFRDELLQILLDSRYRLVQALARPPAASQPDPVRALFLDVWRKLGASVRSAARRGKLGARSLEFLSFISAGDALFALDQAAPALGMRISAADLRRLAHIMAPRATGDPLEFNFNEDEELKRLFKPTEPLANPDALEGNEPAAPGASEAPGNAATPGAPSATEGSGSAPQASPSAPDPSPPRSAPTSLLRVPLWFIEPRAASAAESDVLAPALESVARRLRRAVPDQDHLGPYRSDMQRLLDLSGERECRESGLDARFRPMFRVLVESAAWQESCWRQFVDVRGRIRWLESSTGDIGVMQVNKHVWRGFYSLQRLRWDVLYNAGAGTEILMEMLQHALTHRSSDPVPVNTNLARSAYAAYNGGPDAYNRWRRAEAEPTRSIDAAFYAKYSAVENGDPIDILACASQWGRARGH